MSNNTQENLPVPPKQFVPPKKGEQIFCEGTCYYLGDPIGQGGFGIVYECTDDWANILVAKVLKPQSRTYDQVREEWLAEFTNLKTLRHPCITYMHQAFEYRDTFYLIVERCSYDLTLLIGQPNTDGNVWLPTH